MEDHSLPFTAEIESERIEKNLLKNIKRLTQSKVLQNQHRNHNHSFSRGSRKNKPSRRKTQSKSNNRPRFFIQSTTRPKSSSSMKHHSKKSSRGSRSNSNHRRQQKQSSGLNNKFKHDIANLPNYKETLQSPIFTFKESIVDDSPKSNKINKKNRRLKKRSSDNLIVESRKHSGNDSNECKNSGNESNESRNSAIRKTSIHSATGSSKHQQSPKVEPQQLVTQQFDTIRVLENQPSMAPLNCLTTTQSIKNQEKNLQNVSLFNWILNGMSGVCFNMSPNMPNPE